MAIDVSEYGKLTDKKKKNKTKNGYDPEVIKKRLKKNKDDEDSGEY